MRACAKYVRLFRSGRALAVLAPILYFGVLGRMFLLLHYRTSNSLVKSAQHRGTVTADVAYVRIWDLGEAPEETALDRSRPKAAHVPRLSRAT